MKGNEGGGGEVAVFRIASTGMGNMSSRWDLRSTTTQHIPGAYATRLQICRAAGTNSPALPTTLPQKRALCPSRGTPFRSR